MTRTPRRQPERRPSPTRLPATLLLVFLALVGATVLWLHLWSGSVETPVRDRGPRVEIELGRSPAGGETAPHGQPAPERAPVLPSEAEDQAPPAGEAPPAPPEPPHGQTAPDPSTGETRGFASVAPPPEPPQLNLPPVRTGPPLKPAPDAGLVEQTPSGPLPMTGRDGREPWRVYARPFDADEKRPRIAIVIQGLGVGGAVTRAAVEGLPGAVTLAFLPYADGIGRLVARARAAGHEVLMMVPMEPVNYPVSDPGPQALMTSLKPEENMQRLHWALSRAAGYVGIVSYMGSRFAASRRHVRPVLAEIEKRGLMLLDSGPGNRSVFGEIADEIALPLVRSAMFVDRRLSAADIDARLGELEQIARARGRAVAIARPHPVSIERIAAWASGIGDRGFVLAPVSALAARTRDS